MRPSAPWTASGYDTGARSSSTSRPSNVLSSSGRLRDATIQYLNTRSEWKVYAIYPEPGIGTWGNFEQSKYTDDPFAGPWNHWPISLVPSDGRFAVFHDRVTHFAVGTGDSGEESIIHYGFTNQEIISLVPPARYWQEPPKVSGVSGVSGAEYLGYLKDQKAYHFRKGSGSLSFSIQASEASPLVNPCMVVGHAGPEPPVVTMNGKELTGKELRTGFERDTSGKLQWVIWIPMSSTTETEFEVH